MRSGKWLSTFEKSIKHVDEGKYAADVEIVSRYDGSLGVDVRLD
jgi:hypothetical protein